MAIFSRVKNWVSNEVLTASDLNGEFNNLLTNTKPESIEDYSTDVATMRLTTDPGGSGTESQATSLAGEIERLRFAIKRIAGGAQWYTAPVIDLGSTISAGDIASDAVTTAKILDSNVTTAKIADGAVTTAKMAALNFDTAATCGSVSTTSTSYTTVANQSIVFVSTGRPVEISFRPTSGTTSGIQGIRIGNFAIGYFRVTRDGTSLGEINFTGWETWSMSPAQLNTFDSITAGTYTYLLEFKAASGSQISAFDFFMVVKEL